MVVVGLCLLPPPMGTHVAGAGVPHFLVEADVQVVAGLVGQEEADGDGHGGGRQADVDLHLSLQDPQLPEAAAVAHHHGPYRLLDLGTGQLVGAFSSPRDIVVLERAMLSLETPHCVSTSTDISGLLWASPFPPFLPARGQCCHPVSPLGRGKDGALHSPSNR